MRLALVLLHAVCIGAPVAPGAHLDDVLWDKAREALGASPASTIVHSHFSKWLDTRLDAALGGDAGATGREGIEAFVSNVTALPRRPVIGLRVAKRNASGLCAFVELAAPALERAKHVEAYALTSVGTAANGSPFHPHSLKGCEALCPGAVARLLAQPKLQSWYVAQHWAPPGSGNLSSSKRLRRQQRLDKVQQVPLGLHLTLAAARGLEAAWAAAGSPRALVASYVSLHNHERAFAFEQLKSALQRGGVRLENEFPAKASTPLATRPMNAEQWAARVHARRLAGGKRGSFQATRNASSDSRSTALFSYLHALRSTKFAFSPIGSGLDCHRHYEILAFGAVPLVDYSETLVELYRSLPMVFVRQWTKVTPRTLARAWGAIVDRRGAYDYRELRRDTWRKRVLAFRDRETYAAALHGTPRKRSGGDDATWRRRGETCKGVAKKGRCAAVGDNNVPAAIACPAACAPSLLPPIVIGSGAAAEARGDSLVFEDADNTTTASWVGTSAKAKALGSGKTVHRWARKSHLAKLATFEH